MMKMLTETGVVVGLNGFEALVQTQSRLACRSCAQSKGCGTGVIEEYLSSKTFITPLLNPLNAKVGDVVKLELPKASLVKASLVVYLLPLLLLMAFSAIASFAGFSEAYITIIGIAGLACGFLVIKFYNHKITNNEFYQPVMVSIIKRNDLIQDSSTIKDEAVIKGGTVVKDSTFVKDKSINVNNLY